MGFKVKFKNEKGTYVASFDSVYFQQYCDLEKDQYFIIGNINNREITLLEVKTKEEAENILDILFYEEQIDLTNYSKSSK